MGEDKAHYWVSPCSLNLPGWSLRPEPTWLVPGRAVDRAAVMASETAWEPFRAAPPLDTPPAVAAD